MEEISSATYSSKKKHICIATEKLIWFQSFILGEVDHLDHQKIILTWSYSLKP